jgi:hypothetical protein
MINKTLAQMNAERAAKRAGHNLKLKSSSPHPQSFKPQASSAIKKTQLTDRVKK